MAWNLVWWWCLENWRTSWLASYQPTRKCPQITSIHQIFFLKIFYYAFLVDWRHLWIFPGRKQVTRSSSFPSTITTPNFKPISQTIGELWKRYHQKKKSEKSVQKLKLRGGLEYSSHQLVFFCAIILKLPQLLLLLLFSWRIFYPDFFDLLNFGSLKNNNNNKNHQNLSFRSKVVEFWKSGAAGLWPLTFFGPKDKTKTQGASQTGHSHHQSSAQKPRPLEIARKKISQEFQTQKIGPPCKIIQRKSECDEQRN